MVILAFLIVILSFASPVFLTQSNIFNVIRQVAIGGIVSLGFTVIMASGCLILGVINNGLNLLHVSSYWQMVGKGVIILFAIILDSQSTRIMERHNKGKMGAKAV